MNTSLRSKAKTPLRKWWVLEGDWGGQIYCTIPAHLSDLSKVQLLELLYFVDSQAWPENDGDGDNLYLHEEDDEGLYVIGGMGGGHCLNEQVWIHESLPQDVQETILLVAGIARVC